MKLLNGTFFILLFLAFCAPLFAYEMVRVYSVERENQIDYYADSSGLCPYQIYIVFNSEKVKANTTLPFYTIIQAAEKGKYLFSVLNKYLKPNELKFYSKIVIGDPENVHEDLNYPYIVPYEENAEHRVTQGYNSGYSHVGWQKYSVDIGMPVGTPVCAARDGIIVDVKQDATKGGMSYRFIGEANYITVYQSDGTFAQYLHLMAYGSAFEVGTKVTQGEIIGYSGNTGRSRGPHLHFMVSKPVYLARQSLPVKFVDKSGNLMSLKVRQYYYSYHKNPAGNLQSTNVLTDDIMKDSDSGPLELTNLGGF